MNLLDKLRDLYKQATTDKSHYYTASVLREAIAFIEAVERDNSKSLNKYQVEQSVQAIQAELRAIKRVL